MRLAKTLRFVAVFSVSLQSGGVSVWADKYSGTSAFNFLTIPVGARTVALGQAFTSVPNDVQGMAYNPSLIASMAASQLSFEHLSYVEDITQEAVAYGHAGKREGLSWGVSADYFRISDITRTKATLSPTGDGFTEEGSFSTYDMAFGGTVAAPIGDNFSVGSTVKMLHESLADASSNAAAIDLGGLYQMQEQHSWHAGVALQNLGFASKFADAAVKLPWTFRGGISGQPFSQWLLSGDYVKRQDAAGEFDVGAEVTPRRAFSLRLGYRYQVERPDLGGLSNFSAGIGLRDKNMSLDYAFVPLGDLGQTHRISFNIRFKPSLGPENMQPATAPPAKDDSAAAPEPPLPAAELEQK